MPNLIQFQFRRDSSGTWTSVNPILAQGEFGLETDTLSMKMGDGSTAWNSLAYYSTKIRTGAGAPAGGLGSIGDVYIRTSNNDLYNKTGASTWSVVGNIQGSQGIQGIQGDPGVVQTVTAGDGTLTAGGTTANPTLRIASDVALPGNPTAATQATNNSSTRLATTAFVNNEIANDAPNVALNNVGASPNAQGASLSGQSLTLQPANASFPGLMSAADYTTLQNQRKAFVNILDSGGDNTGVASSAAALTAAQAALPNGGIIWFPPGSYHFGNTNYNLNTAHITLRGAARYNTQFKTTSTTEPIITRNQYFQTIEDITVVGPGTGQNPTATAGSLLSCNAANSAYGVIRRVSSNYAFNCIDISDTLSVVDDAELRYFKGSGIVINQNSDHRVAWITMDNNTSFLPTGGGIQCTLTASLLANNLNVIHANNALNINPGAGVTVPSVKVINSFFDNSVTGLNMSTAGAFYRSEFTNCWFSSMSSGGINLAPTTADSVDGISFMNCDIYNNVAGTTTGVNATGNCGRWKMIGCNIAGWTTGIAIAAGATHFPTLLANSVGANAAFGVNGTGINVGAGTYFGLMIVANDFADNTTDGVIGALTIAAVAATAKRFRIIDNTGLNPRGAITPPIATPVTATTYVNNTGYKCLVRYKGATLTANAAIDGVAYAQAGLANQIVGVVLEPGSTILINGTTLTWSWSAL